MKGVINRGTVKDASASQLRALSGAPRCPVVGLQEFIYNMQMGYETQGQIGIGPIPGTGPITVSAGLPFGKWVLDTTVTITQPVGGAASPSNASFSFGQATGGSGIDDRGFVVPHDRFLISGSWSPAILTSSTDPAQNDGLPPRVAGVTVDWNLGAALFLHPHGPDLDSVLDIDFSKTGTFTQRTILPEQSEFCTYAFCPYILFNPGGSGNVWLHSLNNSAQVSGWNLTGLAQSLYPENTVIGTLVFHLRRVNITPLFNSTILPPRTFAFHNRSLFNPALAPTWDWDFGDGTAHSTAVNPTHTYSNPGQYRVTLTETDASGSHSFDQTVLIPFKAGFTAVVRSRGLAGDTTIAVTDTSLGAVTYDYDWGDGTGHTSNANDTHTYAPGLGLTTFTITQKIGDGFGNFDSATVTLHR